MIDIGYYQMFEELIDEELLELMQSNLDIVNMNENVEKYLIKRFNLVNSLALYNLMNVKILIVTRGAKGANFIFNNKNYFKKIEKPALQIDANGCGDMFFSSIIKDYLINGFKIDENKLDIMFENATKLTTQVISHIGSRGYINPLYKLESDKSELCQNNVAKIKTYML